MALYLAGWKEILLVDEGYMYLVNQKGFLPVDEVHVTR
jgi:hypothetical protein